jgi:crotonobetainyl-CoA:carnitine CoA-transferase CaiB-like acyl-CoA transferase
MPDLPSRERPLGGIRVVDFSRVLAGPFCTRMLSDLGAEVIKIEPPDGDLSRRLGPRRGGMSGYYLQQNCGKRNVSIDLKAERGRDLAVAIAGRSDVVVENFRPGVMDALELGAEHLRGLYPRLVYCSISGFGHAGPWRERRAFAGIAHSTTGVLYRQAHAWSMEPRDSVLALGDTVTGLQATIAILSALKLRERTGRGQTIDMAMHDALLSVQEAANFYLFPDGATEHDFLCSWVYRCGEEHVAMPTDPRADWDVMCEVMGRPELARDARYETYPKRAERLDELEAHIQDWVMDQDAADTVVAALDRAGLPGARIMRMSEALDCEQTRARGMTRETDDRSGASVRVLNSPYRFSEAEAGVRGRAAFRGEDNRTVLSEVLGMSEIEIDALEREGVISARLPGEKPPV